MRELDWEAHARLIAVNGLTIDRPRFSRHPDHPEIVYPIDYGYINGTIGEDGQEIDVFVGTAATGLVGALFTVDHRKGDREVKLLYDCAPTEVYLAHGFINFAPAYMSGELLMRTPMPVLWTVDPPGGAPEHLDLNVSDLGVSGPFYEALLGRLGYRAHQRWAEGMSFRKGDFYLVLVQAGPHREAGFHRKRVGLNHLAFTAPSRAFIDAIHREFLPPRGVPVLYGGPREEPGGRYTLFFEDPDRVKLELVHRTHAFL